MPRTCRGLSLYSSVRNYMTRHTHNLFIVEYYLNITEYYFSNTSNCQPVLVLRFLTSFEIMLDNGL